MEIVLDDLRTEIAARVNSDLAVVRVRWRRRQRRYWLAFAKADWVMRRVSLQDGCSPLPRFSFSVSAVLMTLMFRLLSRPGP